MESVMMQKAGSVIEGRRKAQELQEEAKQMLDHAMASLQKLRGVCETHTHTRTQTHAHIHTKNINTRIH